MLPTLKPGLEFSMRFEVPETKTVPHLYPEAPEFQQMPRVLATGFMVGLLEWACLRAMIPYLDWPDEQSVGTLVSFTHLAPTPPGLVVTVEGMVTAVEGRKVGFRVQARDGVDLITEGTHERHVIEVRRFEQTLARKRASAGLG